MNEGVKWTTDAWVGWLVLQAVTGVAWLALAVVMLLEGVWVAAAGLLFSGSMAAFWFRRNLADYRRRTR